MIFIIIKITFIIVYIYLLYLNIIFYLTLWIYYIYSV